MAHNEVPLPVWLNAGNWYSLTSHHWGIPGALVPAASATVAQNRPHAQTFASWDIACREGSSLHLRTAGLRWWLGGCPVDARAVLVTVCLTTHAYLLLLVLVIPLRCTIIESGFPGQ